MLMEFTFEGGIQSVQNLGVTPKNAVPFPQNGTGELSDIVAVQQSYRAVLWALVDQLAGKRKYVAFYRVHTKKIPVGYLYVARVVQIIPSLVDFVSHKRHPQFVRRVPRSLASGHGQSPDSRPTDSDIVPVRLAAKRGNKTEICVVVLSV